MTTPALPVENWQIAYHETMAAVLRANENVRREAGFLGIAWIMWDVASRLKNLIRLLADLHSSMCAMPADVGVPVELLQASIESTAELIEAINGLLETAKRAGLNNRTLTAGSLLTIWDRSDEIEEYLDTLRLSVDPEVERAIQQGREDLAAGRTISLDSLLHG